MLCKRTSCQASMPYLPAKPTWMQKLCVIFLVCSCKDPYGPIYPPAVYEAM